MLREGIEPRAIEMGHEMKPFADSEYGHRRETVRAAADAAGLDGILVWSRGAGTNERHANTVYLANAYSTFPFIPDNPPAWSGRGHTVLIIPTNGEPELLLDVAHSPDDGIAMHNVRTCQRIVEDTIDALERHGLSTGRVGLAGCDVLPVAWYWSITNALPNMQLEPADRLLDDIRAAKSPAEQEILRRTAKKGLEAMSTILDAAEPGRTKGEIMGVGLDAMARSGLMPYDLRLSVGSNLASSSLAGMPGRDYETRICEGELLRVDLVASFAGYYVDFARSIVIGHAPDADQRRLLDAARESVYAVIRAVQSGVTGDELAQIGIRKLDEFGLAPPEDPQQNRATGFASFGHGLGLAWERPWLNRGSQDVVLTGMCLAVEQKVGVDGIGGATFEENLLVHEDGVEILTH
jgi:Xaa-Pro aminopeptidase